jgi:type II secretory pathway component GspD/PulD (secretin)
MLRLAAFLILIMSANVHAQMVLTFDVEEQSLADALRVIGAQSNMNILYDPTLVKGRSTHAFKMQSTADEALTRLLQGTDLKIQYINEKTVTLVQVPPASSIVADTRENAAKGAAPGVSPTKPAKK